MMFDGIQCKRSRVFGFRSADPETDVDDKGRPLHSNYIVIVRVKDCPVVEKDGKRFYNPKGVKQAVVLGMGGTYYGYAKTQIVRHGDGRYVLCPRPTGSRRELMFSYRKTPMYFVRDGHVYVGACYGELRAEDLKAA